MKLILLPWSSNFFIVPETANNQVATFAIADTKLYVSVVTLSNQDNIKPLQQSIEEQNRYLDFRVDLNFWE